MESIEYCLWKGKLFAVWIFTKGYDNFSGLRAAKFDEFGWGHQPNRHVGYYIWRGPVAEMQLRYGVRQVRSLLMKSEKLRQERDFIEKKKVIYAHQDPISDIVDMEIWTDGGLIDGARRSI